MKKIFPIVIVSGLSGSGKSTALHIFEDMGFFTVDGMPASFAPQLALMLQESSLINYKGLVWGLDLRQQDFAENAETAINTLQKQGFSPRLIFLEAQPSVLLQRYMTSRRPHPLEKEGFGLEKALEEERQRMEVLRNKAELVLDTSSYSIHDLRRTLQAKWEVLNKNTPSLRVHIITFGFKYGTPAEADMVFDLRFLPNPYFVPELKALSGKDKSVAEFVLHKDPGAKFMQQFSDFLLYLLPEFEVEGRFRMTIAIGCTGGRHRSVAVAEALYTLLQEKKFLVSLEHRHLNLDTQ